MRRHHSPTDVRDPEGCGAVFSTQGRQIEEPGDGAMSEFERVSGTYVTAQKLGNSTFQLLDSKKPSRSDSPGSAIRFPEPSKMV
jgi:hypothetical protein